jgi:hypothetical protein
MLSFIAQIFLFCFAVAGTFILVGGLITFVIVVVKMIAYIFKD